jgi:hypothetical protein
VAKGNLIGTVTLANHAPKTNKPLLLVINIPVMASLTSIETYQTLKNNGNNISFF